MCDASNTLASPGVSVVSAGNSKEGQMPVKFSTGQERSGRFLRALVAGALNAIPGRAMSGKQKSQFCSIFTKDFFFKHSRV